MERREPNGKDCAAAIAASHMSGVALDGVRLSRTLVNEDLGYRSQRLAGAILEAGGLGPVVGYKVGVTTSDMQAEVGVHEPLYGAIHEHRLLKSGERLRSDTERPRGFECEIAVTLGADLPRRQTPYTEHSVATAVASFHPAIEIVENRLLTREGVSPWVLVGDSAFHYGCVLGPPASSLIDPRALEGEISIDGVILHSGKASALHGGGPLSVLAWLANKLIAHETPLKAGNVVLCGSLTPVAWLKPEVRSSSKRVRASFDGFGEAVLLLN